MDVTNLSFLNPIDKVNLFSETEDAWHSLFKLITYGMRKGYEENKEDPSKEAVSLQEVSENLQAVDVNSDENVFE